MTGEQPKERPGSDNLRDAFTDFKRRRAPKEMAEHAPPDAPPIPTGPARVTHIEVSDDGTQVNQFEGSAWVSKPVTPKIEGERE